VALAVVESLLKNDARQVAEIEFVILRVV